MAFPDLMADVIIFTHFDYTYILFAGGQAEHWTGIILIKPDVVSTHNCFS